MDSISINDLIFELIRAFVMLMLLSILFFRGSYTSLARHPGWKNILVGFCLITAANLLDITDEIPGLAKYVIIGDTIYEAFLEKFPGYLLGFVMLLIGFYKMIPSLLLFERHEKALHENEERLRQIFVANPDPVILARVTDGTIIDVNPGFELQIGFRRDEVLGKNSADIDFWAIPDKRDEFRSQLLQTGVVDNFEADYRDKHGQVRNGLLSARLIDLAGEHCKLVVVRDISKIKEAEQALLKVDQIRSEFISTAAHELRTPLTVLIGYAELLTETQDGGGFSAQERLSFLEEIKEKGFLLGDIIDDLLDLSRIDAGLKFRLTPEQINPHVLLIKTLDQFKLQYPGHHFSLDLDQSNTPLIECDSQRIKQVLENLLSNAVKYSPRGSLVTLTGTLHSDTYDFSVTDAGAGMTAEQIERVFDKFYRADSSDTAISGLGLGMSIVKQIVDTHGGSISIASTPGSGTCVTVKLPSSPVLVA